MYYYIHTQNIKIWTEIYGSKFMSWFYNIVNQLKLEWVGSKCYIACTSSAIYHIQLLVEGTLHVKLRISLGGTNIHPLEWDIAKYVLDLLELR